MSFMCHVALQVRFGTGDALAMSVGGTPVVRQQPHLKAVMPVHLLGVLETVSKLPL